MKKKKIFKIILLLLFILIFVLSNLLDLFSIGQRYYFATPVESFEKTFVKGKHGFDDDVSMKYQMWQCEDMSQRYYEPLYRYHWRNPLYFWRYFDYFTPWYTRYKFVGFKKYSAKQKEWKLEEIESERRIEERRLKQKEND